MVGLWSRYMVAATAVLMVASTGAAQAAGSGHGSEWAPAPLACLPSRAEKWKTASDMQPCHCPPPDFCPKTDGVKPENLQLTVQWSGATNGSGIIMGNEVADLVNGSVTITQFFGMNNAEIKALLLNVIESKFGINTRRAGIYNTIISVSLVGGDFDDWINDTLKMPITLATRCCDSFCPEGLTPTFTDKQVVKPRGLDEGIPLQPAYYVQLNGDVDSFKNGLSNTKDTLKPLKASLGDLSAKLNGITLPLSDADLGTLLGLAGSANSKTSILNSAEKNQFKNNIKSLDEFERKLVDEKHVRSQPVEYITIKSVTCAIVKSYPREGCLMAGTQITMADGTKKNIEDLTLDDVVKGNHGPAKIIALSKFTQQEDYVYSINKGKAFFTIEHPVLTPKGWKSVDGNVTSIKSDAIFIGSLAVGDTILMEGGKEMKVESIDKQTMTGGVSAYNLSVQGDGSFIANGLIMKSFKKMQMHY